MPLDQLNEIKAAIQRHDYNLIGIAILAAVACGIASYLGAYFTERAKIKAMKRDLRQVTEIAESAKSQIESRQHFSHFRYDLEVGLYKDFWKKLLPLYDLALFFQFGPDMEAKAATLGQAQKDFFEAIRDNYPFYPKEIWQQLNSFAETCASLASSQSSMGTVRNEKMLEEFSKNVDNLHHQVKEQLRKIEDAIRERIQKFDVG